MYDPLKNQKAEVKQAQINVQLASKYRKRQYDQAKAMSRSWLSCPSGIASMFIAGSINGARSHQPAVKSPDVISLLLKFL